MIRLASKTAFFAAVAAVAMFLPLLCPAQTFNVIHYFEGSGYGAYPEAGLTIDRFGKLYATTLLGGVPNCDDQPCGAVIQLAPRGTSWVLTPLYYFENAIDGYQPNGPVALGSSGELYGLSSTHVASGSIYELRPRATPPRTALSRWTETTLFSFNGTNGAQPYGRLAVDAAGNLYGATYGGSDNGTVFELTHNGNGWTQSTLYSFQGGSDGGNPKFGVVIDSGGNLFGTTSIGGVSGCGTVFELSPSGSGWTESTLYQFTGGSDGCNPSGGLTLDSSGNLYGNTNSAANGGTTYELARTGGGWNFNLLQSYAAFNGGVGDLALDAAGNLYGTTTESVFKLQNDGGSWIYSSLHDFSCGLDGCGPLGASIDPHGNIFGATETGGITNIFCSDGCGVVWEVTP